MTDKSTKDIVVNLIIGIVLGYFMFGFFRKDRYKGPNSKDIVNKIYTHNGKEYKFVTKVCLCPVF